MKTFPELDVPDNDGHTDGPSKRSWEGDYHVLRQCVKRFEWRERLRSNKHRGSRRRGLARWTNAKDFKVVTMDREIRIPGQVAHDIFEGTSRERDHGPAFRADQMMAMSGFADDIRWVAAGLEQSRQHIDRSQDLEGAVDRGTADLRHFGD